MNTTVKSPLVMPSPGLIITIMQPNMLEKTIIGTMTLTELQTVFQRALNTWSDVPPHLLQLADGLQTMSDMHEIMVKRQMAAMRAQNTESPNPPVTSAA